MCDPGTGELCEQGQGPPPPDMPSPGSSPQLALRLDFLFPNLKLPLCACLPSFWAVVPPAFWALSPTPRPMLCLSLARLVLQPLYLGSVPLLAGVSPCRRDHQGNSILAHLWDLEGSRRV